MLVFATADWVIPVITGVIGLLGVLIGALVSGAIERKQLESRDHRQLCIAARLLYDELTTNRAAVEAMRATESFLPMKTELWAKVRTDLAAPEIDIDDFKLLTVAYIQIEFFNEGYDEESEWEKIDPYIDDASSRISRQGLPRLRNTQERLRRASPARFRHTTTSRALWIEQHYGE